MGENALLGVVLTDGWTSQLQSLSLETEDWGGDKANGELIGREVIGVFLRDSLLSQCLPPPGNKNGYLRTVEVELP